MQNFPQPIKTPPLNPQTGMMSPEWIRWLNSLFKRIEQLETDLAAAEARITALEA